MYPCLIPPRPLVTTWGLTLCWGCWGFIGCWGFRACWGCWGCLWPRMAGATVCTGLLWPVLTNERRVLRLLTNQRPASLTWATRGHAQLELGRISAYGATPENSALWLVILLIMWIRDWPLIGQDRSRFVIGLDKWEAGIPWSWPGTHQAHHAGGLGCRGTKRKARYPPIILLLFTWILIILMFILLCHPGPLGLISAAGHRTQLQILACDWSRQITWSKYSSLIGRLTLGTSSTRPRTWNCSATARNLEMSAVGTATSP